MNQGSLMCFKFIVTPQNKIKHAYQNNLIRKKHGMRKHEKEGRWLVGGGENYSKS